MDQGEMSIEMQILQRLTAVETKLDLQFAAKDTAVEAKTLSIENKSRLDKMDDNIKWMWRTVIGALIVTAITLYVKSKGGVL